ncbi:MAG: divalent-cation tolerance protein CutA [Firmicutes bacterium]|nr:divalent-cation tolerance protein CutA [Bacillota bacterium]
MSDEILVYITAQDAEEASRIGRELVQRRLAACANVVPAIRSFYWWHGSVVEDGEALLFLKTRAAVLEELVDAVRGMHSYSVPCVTAFRVIGGNPAYLEWLAGEVMPGAAARPDAKSEDE